MRKLLNRIFHPIDWEFSVKRNKLFWVTFSDWGFDWNWQQFIIGIEYFDYVKIICFRIGFFTVEFNLPRNIILK